MLSALALVAYRRPRRILAVALVLGIAAAGFGASTPAHLTSSDDDFQDKASESYRTFQALSRATHVVPGPSVLVVGTPAEARTAVARLRRERSIARVDSSVSRDGRLVLVAAWFAESSQHRAALTRTLARELPGEVGGAAVASEEVRAQSERDLFRAELIAFPLLLVLALWVFRGLVAALLPLAAGLLSIASTLALLRLVNTVSPISVFALNLVTGAGLGLAIDYSLLLVSRYREELERVGPGWEALRATIESAGRTVAFSAVTVAAAFGSLLVFPLAFLRSMALGGLIVAPLAGVVALTVLPALFALLGPRVNALAVGRVRVESRGWYRFSHWVMRRPVPVALVSATLLVALGIPFLGVRFVGVDATVLPTNAEPRRASDLIQREFPRGLDYPLHVVAASRGTVAQVRPLAGVVSVGAPVRVGDRWAFDVVPSGAPDGHAATSLVRAVRKLPGVAVTGRTAWFVDTSASLKRHLPGALAILAVTVFALLFLVTRSLVLPLKAVVMNALSLSAAFGILVWIFQDGRLEGLLHYKSQGALELTQPVLLFAIAFGLATDYGVFLLARIREAHEDGLPNREAVALGLERTGRVITAAALLFCVAVGSFATSGIVIVKEMGLGIALAVLIDATLVRALLVPSLMALLGDWNWWRPGQKPG